MTLRGRLLLALAYILLLAIVALEVPLAITLSNRVDAEIRSEAQSQAELLAAGAAGKLTDDRQHEHVAHGQQQPRAEAYGSSPSAAAKRKPTPRTVWM